MAARLTIALVLVSALCAAAGAATRAEAGVATCPPDRVSAATVRRIEAVLRARMDVWGNELLARPGGPTYERVRRYLPPLLLARAAGRPLTRSGVHYLALGRPAGPQGSGSVPLHVADGSQIVSQRWLGPTLTVGVGREGSERYGSCLARLTPPSLAAGYLPILRTAYVDEIGTRYRQESFAAPLPGTEDLASFVRISVEAGHADGAATVRLTPSQGRPIVRPVGSADGLPVYAAWLNRRAPGRLHIVDSATYEEARRSVRAYWLDRLGDGSTVLVPERRVMDAMRNLLIQNLVLTWRYSVGNHYQELATADGIAAAGVIGAYGFADVEREIVRTALGKRSTPFANWKMGAKLAGAGRYFQHFRDRAFVEETTPVLAGYVRALGRQIESGHTGLLPRERFSQDVAEPVLGLHTQAVVWQGLRLQGAAWEATGHPELAARCRRLASRLGSALRRAVRASETRLPDGSLFVPVRLLDHERPYDALSATRNGSYWNLVMPYALASGLFQPGGREARGVLRYMLLHGSRLLGLVRAGAYALYGDAPYPTSGTDHVYGLSMARFLADNDEPDQLVLSLYGQLAASMTQGTFVAGEAASVAPLEGERYRTMFLPPNGTANAAFLETLRLMLVHETTDARGRPRSLELAFATPRAWLAPGKRITVRDLPTSFGSLTYTLVRTPTTVRITIDLPSRVGLRSVRLRLRLPRPFRVHDVAGRGLATLEPDGETIRLQRDAGRVEIVAHVGRA